MTPEENAYWDMVADTAVRGEVDVNYWKIAQIVRRVLKYDLWGSTVIEIGAGIPFVAMNLLNMVKFQYNGLEPSARFRDAAVSMLGIQLKAASAYALQCRSQSADFFFAFDVLEHVSRDDRDRSYQEIGRVLKPGGLMLIHNPCEGNYQGHKKKFEPGFSLQDLQLLIDTAGMKLAEIEVYAITLPTKNGPDIREYQWITLVKK